MSDALLMQYGIILLLVLAAATSLYKRLRGSAKQKDCDSGCGCCSASCGVKQPDSATQQRVIKIRPLN